MPLNFAMTLRGQFTKKRPAKNIETNKLFTEARARIIWGDSSLSVHDFIISNGISDTVVDVKIKEFLLERNTELRKIGIRYILIGPLLTGAAGITLYIIFPHFTTYAQAVCAAMLVIIGGYGIWKLVTGIILSNSPTVRAQIYTRHNRVRHHRVKGLWHRKRHAISTTPPHVSSPPHSGRRASAPVRSRAPFCRAIQSPKSSGRSSPAW